MNATSFRPGNHASGRTTYVRLPTEERARKAIKKLANLGLLSWLQAHYRCVKDDQVLEEDWTIGFQPFITL